ncbi:glycosyltransferase [Dyella humicola]|uniref:glycosyltransferase n=1 Tax=Dyella humicola TaxID=2992126 RepID=UPI00224E0AC4
MHELAKRLTDRFDVTVLCPRAANAAREECLERVRVLRYRYAPGRWATLVNDGGILANLRQHPWKWLLVPSFITCQWIALFKLKLRWRPDVVHAHWLIPQGVIGAWAGVTPFVVTSHGADLFALQGKLFKWLRAKVVERAAAVTVVSDAMRQRLQSECPGTQVLTMPMGVDMDERFGVSTQDLGSTHTLLFVGRLVEKKGLIYLIEAMPEIVASHPGARLDIVGFGPEGDRLKDRVKHLGLDSSVRFVGAVPQSDLPGYYRSATAFVAPFVQASGGDQEGLGLVVAEAIGCQCPVIVGDVPAVHDLIGDVQECIVPQRDSPALAKAIIRVLDDPESARQQAVALRASIYERFSWTSVAKGYAELFSSLTIEGSRSA